MIKSYHPMTKSYHPMTKSYHPVINCYYPVTKSCHTMAKNYHLMTKKGAVMQKSQLVLVPVAQALGLGGSVTLENVIREGVMGKVMRKIVRQRSSPAKVKGRKVVLC